MKPKYWYEVLQIICPPCGSVDEYKERKYTPKPKNRANRYKFIEEMCYQCQVSMFG